MSPVTSSIDYYNIQPQIIAFKFLFLLLLRSIVNLLLISRKQEEEINMLFVLCVQHIQTNHTGF